jgi:hypothetical protein
MKAREEYQLRERVRCLERENAQLKAEVNFLRRVPRLSQGLKGEALVAQLTGGVPTGYGKPHDLTIRTGDRLEVKFSHLNVPGNSATRRWNWHGVLGYSNNKQYEYLVLVGEKDPRYVDQYPTELPYAFFLVPRAVVDRIRTGSDIACNTNLDGLRAAKSLILKNHLVMVGKKFTELCFPIVAAG